MKREKLDREKEMNHRLEIECADCGKKTAYFACFYNKRLCIKCDLKARQLRTIRTEGNKIIRDIIKGKYS